MPGASQRRHSSGYIADPTAVRCCSGRLLRTGRRGANGGTVALGEIQKATEIDGLKGDDRWL